MYWFYWSVAFEKQIVENDVALKWREEGIYYFFELLNANFDMKIKIIKSTDG